MNTEILENNNNFDNALSSALNTIGYDNEISLPKIQSIRDYFTRRLNKRFNKDDNDAELPESFKYTFDSRRFLQYDNKKNDERILIFHTEKNMSILKKANFILCDATFFTAPRGYEQLLIIHAIYFNKSLPLIYVFMQRKNFKAYNIVFEYIKKSIEKDPEYFNIDFEYSLFIAIKHTFPTSKIRGCAFHLSQIIIRFIKSNYPLNFKHDMNYKKFTNYIYLLCFVPVDCVKKEFKKIKESAPSEECYTELLKFFENNFIVNIKKIENKNLIFWNAHERALLNLPYTTNSCEAYHRYLNSKNTRKNRPLYRIIDLLKKEEQRIGILISNLKSGKINAVNVKKAIYHILFNYNYYEGFEFFDELGKYLKMAIN